MEIKQYIFLFRRWLWLLIVATGLGAGGAAAASYLQEPIYQSTAKVLLVQSSKEAISDLGYLSAQQLVQTYAELLLTDPLLDEVSNEVGTNISPRQINVNQVRDTRILSVSVEDTDPTRASRIANLLIDVLVRNNDEIQNSQFAASEESLLNQIAVVQEQIASLQSEANRQSLESLESRTQTVEQQISALQQEIVNVQLQISEIASPTGYVYNALDQSRYQELLLELEQRQSALTLYQDLYFNLVSQDPNSSLNSLRSSSSGQLVDALALYQQIYSNLLGNYETIRLARLENSSVVIKVEPAQPNFNPIRPKTVNNVLLGALVGLMIGAAIVVAIEYLDDSVKSPESVAEIIHQPVLGYIPEIPNLENESSEAMPYVDKFPRSPVAEAYRTLRTNIEFAGAASPIKTLLVTSAQPGDGKTSISTNLASVIVQAGKRAMVIDADMRRPALHRLFGLDNRMGLSEYFRGISELKDIINPVNPGKEFMVITSGKLPPNPAELLASKKFSQMFEQLNDFVDIIIIDSPPLTISDPIILSSKVDATMLVIRPGETRASALKIAAEQLGRANSRVIGAIFNRVTRQTSSYYYQDYYATYYSHTTAQESDGTAKQKERKKQKPTKKGK